MDALGPLVEAVLWRGQEDQRVSVGVSLNAQDHAGAAAGVAETSGSSRVFGRAGAGEDLGPAGYQGQL